MKIGEEVRAIIKIFDGINWDAVFAGLRALQVALRQWGEATLRLHSPAYRVALETYASHHLGKRLPGSDKTSRLRKKRVKTIMNWYFEYLQEVHGRAVSEVG